MIILGSILFLGTVTVFGMTGFVRGGWFSGLLGVLLAVVDGIFFTLIMVFSKKLNHAGVHTTAVLGLRLPLYVFFTAALAGLTWREGTHHSPGDMVRFVCLGVLLTLPPLYLVQKAVPMVSTLTLSSVTALGPLFVLAMQLLEGRVEYKHVTSLGLVIYMVGAMFAAYGSAIGDTRKASSSA